MNWGHEFSTIFVWESSGKDKSRYTKFIKSYKKQTSLEKNVEQMKKVKRKWTPQAAGYYQQHIKEERSWSFWGHVTKSSRSASSWEPKERETENQMEKDREGSFRLPEEGNEWQKTDHCTELLTGKQRSEESMLRQQKATTTRNIKNGRKS